MHLWGIDLGGTKIEGAVVDGDRPGETRARLRLPTEAERGYDHIVGQIVRLVANLEEATGQRRPNAIGVGTPGAVEPSTGKMKNSNTLCLNGRTLRKDLADSLGLEVRIANDANCFALAEALIGSARGYPNVFGIILGTGVGGGVVIGGKVVDGRHGIAGEWGHNPIPGEDAPCYCGRRGCVETVVSGPALERYYEAKSGRKLRLADIARLAAQGEGAATETLARLQEKLGVALGAAVNLLDPDAIVFGGGVGNLDGLYGETMRTAIRRNLFNPELTTALLKPTLGDSAGVFGAALLTVAGP
ncbi:MAG: ROK family protein [Opitutaceae bacterium]